MLKSFLIVSAIFAVGGVIIGSAWLGEFWFGAAGSVVALFVTLFFTMWLSLWAIVAG